MVSQDDPHTGHQELFPGNLAVSEHPGQDRRRIRAEAGAFKTSPANRVGHQHGGDTKGQPGPLRDGHRVIGLMRANGGVNGVNKGTHEGAGFPMIIGVSRPSGVHTTRRRDGRL
jgi:hypothetical protein